MKIVSKKDCKTFSNKSFKVKQYFFLIDLENKKGNLYSDNVLSFQFCL